MTTTQQNSLSREINILTEPTSDRTSKKSALEKILKHLIQIQDAPDFKNVCVLIMKCLTKSLVDPIEKCREISMKILETMVTRVDDLYQFLPNLMPLYTARLGQLQVVEPSEEIRIQMIKTLNNVVVRTGNSFSPFTEETVNILARTCQDSFQNIRKESFLLIINLCKSVARALALHGGAVTKMILPSLSHRHSSVRIAALQALSASMIVDASAIDESIDPLRALTRDKTPSVREHLYTLAKDWLTQLMDRHVYGLKIVPFLYAGVTDDLPKLSALCIEYLDQVGAQYEKENNDRIKDELDYSDGIIRPDRPRPGCRHLARDNTQKIIQKQIELLGDWNLETRYQAAKVLTVFMEHAEVNATGYISVMVQPIYKVLAGDEPYVMEQTVKLMEKVGFFVSPETTMSLLLPAISGGGQGAFRTGCLRALQGVLRGSSADALRPHMSGILSSLSDRDLTLSESVPVIVEVAKCFGELGTKLSSDSQVLFQFFFSLVHLESFPGDPKVVGWSLLQDSVQKALNDHAVHQGTTIEALYAAHFDQAIHFLSESYTTWSQYSYEPRVLKSLLYKGGSKVGERFDRILPIFTECAKFEKDFELRESILKMSLYLIDNKLIEKAQLNPFVSIFLKEVILCCCIWRAGKKPAVIRSGATLLLLRLFHLYTNLEVDLWVEPVFQADLLPVLCSNMDDDDQSTRHNCLAIVGLLLKVPGIWNAEAFKKLYPELLKRMDDAKDEVRIETASVFAVFFPAIKTWTDSLASLKAELELEERDGTTIVRDGVVIELRLDRCHFESIIDGLLIHMDDADHRIQEAVCVALIAGKESVLARDLLVQKLNTALTKHRSRQYLELLLN